MEEERLIQLIRLADASIKDDLLKFSKRKSLPTQVNIFSELGNCISSLREKESLLNTQRRQMTALFYSFLYLNLAGKVIDGVKILFFPRTLMGYTPTSPEILNLSSMGKIECEELTGEITITDVVVSTVGSIYLSLSHRGTKIYMELEEFRNLIPQLNEAGK